MPHFSFSKQNTSDHFSSIIFNFCFSIFSHPLYFSYFIFFSPYILKLVSFLSPLFITTTLLLLALFTISPNYFVLDANDDSEISESKLGFFLSNFQTLILVFELVQMEMSPFCFNKHNIACFYLLHLKLRKCTAGPTYGVASSWTLPNYQPTVVA